MKRRFFLISIGSFLLIGATYFTASKTVASLHTSSDDLKFIENSLGTQDVVRVMPYQVNGIVYRPQNERLYFTQPGTVGEGGNTISVLHPITGEIESSTYIGSEPGQIALSDDGHSMYVVLDGAFAIRRFDAATGEPGLEFPVGINSSNRFLAATDVAVAPNNPERIAVARLDPQTSPGGAGVAVYDNGIRLPNITSGHSAGANFLAFSASASTLYGGGYTPGLRIMTVDGAGATEPGSLLPFNVRQLRFEGGRIFTSTGQIIDPAVPALLGTFSVSSPSAFVPDSEIRRAFYASRDYSTGTILLKAFDMDTFVPVGVLTIPNANSDPVSLIRYGTNGLALRTQDKQLYLIQTSLIPTDDPLPTPSPTGTITPTPTPTPHATEVRVVNLGQANDMLYNEAFGRLLVSVPSVAGASGNSIAIVDPTTAAVDTSIWIGSEPNKLALTGDQHGLFVGLDGAAAVRKLDLSTATPDYQFSLGSSPNGPGRAVDLDVQPDSSSVIAVSNHYASAAIYDSGVRRGIPVNSGGFLDFRNSDELLVSGFGNLVNRHEVGASGLDLMGTLNGVDPVDFAVSNNRLFSRYGKVFDIANDRLLGTYIGQGSGYSFLALAVDSGRNRVFFLASEFSGPLRIRAYRLDTFVQVGTIELPGISASNSTSLVRWGSDGLAFRDELGRIFLIRSTLVDPSVVLPTPTPTISPTPMPTPAYTPTFVRQVELPVNDIVLGPADDSLYVSIASTAGPGTGNTISKIDPSTGQLESSAFIGSEPSRLAISSDGQVIYAKLDGAGDAVRRFDVAANSAGLQFNGPVSQQDMKVMPGAPQTVAFASGSNDGVSIYDSGVRRPNVSNGTASGIYSIEFADPNVIYGFNNFTSSFDLIKFEVNESGIVAPAFLGNAWISGWGSQIQYSNDRLFGSSGAVFDTGSLALEGTFRLDSPSVQAQALDLANNKVFFVGNNGVGNPRLAAFDATTFLPLGSIRIPNMEGTPTRLVRWGTNGLAMRTYVTGSPNQGRLYLIQSELVSPTGIVPTAVQFSNSSFGGSEGNSTIPVTVSRSAGGLTGSTSVSYTTIDGTARAGEDYVAATGMVTFQPGETSKTINIELLNDNIYEGTETFGISLTDVSGGTVYIMSPSSATISIFDNDPFPMISGAASSAQEPQPTSNYVLQIPVSLANRSVETVTVNYNIVSGTAVAGSDFVATNGILTFAPLESTKTIPVTILGDSTIEGSESFSINLNTPINGYIGNPNIPVTILESVFEADVTPRVAGDGSVISGDVIQLRRFATGLDLATAGTTEFQRADGAPRASFGDGIINSGDVIQARRYATGLDPLTPADGPLAAGEAIVSGPMLDGLWGAVFEKSNALRMVSGPVLDRSGRREVSRVEYVELDARIDVAGVLFKLAYDRSAGEKPTVTLAEGLPEKAILTVNDSVDGELTILIDSTEPLAVGRSKVQLVNITFGEKVAAEVPIVRFVGDASSSDLFGNSVRVLTQKNEPLFKLGNKW